MSKLTVRVVLGLLLAWSLGLRVWYAVPGLNSTRFWDERYPLENVESILKEGHLRPANGLHPSLTHLPQTLVLEGSAALYRTIGHEKLAVFDARGDFTPTAYLLCRLVEVFFGTLGLLLVFLIGRRLGDERLGLLGAFFLAVVPFHIHASVKFMADGMLIFTLILAFYMSLRAVARPTLLSYALAGLAIGLALSSKFNAGPIAIPLVVGTLVSRDRSWRTFGLLVCAGITSVIVFLALNPYVLIDFEIFRASFGRTLRVYERHGQTIGIESKFELFWLGIKALLSPLIHGPFVGILALVGVPSLAVVSIRNQRNSATAIGWLMLLSYLLAYPILYAMSTSNPDAHNWLPISPFMALAAAWMLIRLYDRGAEFLTQSQARLASAASVALIVIALGWSATRFTYTSTVPTTGDRALSVLASELRRAPSGRLILSEHDFRFWRRQTRHLRRRLAVETVPDLSTVSSSMLNWADAEVFPASRLSDPETGAFYQRRVDRLHESRVVVVKPRLFESWGPVLIALPHPMRQVGNARSGEWVRAEEDRSLYVARMPVIENPRAILSLEFGLPGRKQAVEIESEGRRFVSVTFRAPRDNLYQITPRFRYSKQIEMRLPAGKMPPRIPFVVRSWRKAGGIKRPKPSTGRDDR